MPVKFLLDVDDTILKEVQIKTYQDHDQTQLLKYCPSQKFREGYITRLTSPPLIDANKVCHYRFLSTENPPMMESLVCLRPTILDWLSQLEPYILDGRIEPYLFSANDDRRTEAVLTQLNFNQSSSNTKTLQDYGFRMIPRGKFLVGDSLKKSLIILRNNLGWKITEDPIVVVDDCLVELDQNGNDYQLPIYPFGRNLVTNYLNHGSAELEFLDDSQFIHLMIDAIDQRLTLPQIKKVEIDPEFLNYYLSWNLEKNQQIRITRYFMYQQINQAIQQLKLDQLSGQGLVFGGSTLLTKLFPKINWRITELSSSDQLDITQPPPTDFSSDQSATNLKKYDLIVADQVLEHVLTPWTVPQNLAQHYLKPGGYVLVAVPFLCPVHNYPIDCFRFTLTGLSSLFSSYFTPIFQDSFGNRQLLNYRLNETKHLSVSQLMAQQESLGINNPRHPLNLWYCGRLDVPTDAQPGSCPPDRSV